MAEDTETYRVVLCLPAPLSALARLSDALPGAAVVLDHGWGDDAVVLDVPCEDGHA